MAERITSLEALQAIGKKVAENHQKYRLRLMICGSNDCQLTGSGKSGRAAAYYSDLFVLGYLLSRRGDIAVRGFIIGRKAF